MEEFVPSRSPSDSGDGGPHYRDLGKRSMEETFTHPMNPLVIVHLTESDSSRNASEMAQSIELVDPSVHSGDNGNDDEEGKEVDSLPDGPRYRCRTYQQYVVENPWSAPDQPFRAAIATSFAASGINNTVKPTTDPRVAAKIQDPSRRVRLGPIWR